MKNASAERAARPALLTVLLVLAAVAALALQHARILPLPLFPLDDAYITFHNADVLLAGEDRNFPGISPLAGATSPIHLFLVTVAAVFAPTVWALWIVDWLAVALYAVGVCRLAAVLRAPPWATVALLGVALGAGDALFQLLNGIETGLAMAAVAWVLALQLEERERGIALPLLLGALPFVRPELALLSVAILVERAYVRQLPWSGRLRGFVRECAIAAAAAAPWLLAFQIELGSILPTTIAAKRNFFAEGCMPAGEGLRRYSTILADLFVRILQFSSVGLFLLPVRRFGRLLALFVLAFLLSYFAGSPGAIAHNYSRYAYVLLPVMVTGFLFALVDRRLWLRRLAAVCVIAALGSTLLGLPRATRLYQGDINLTWVELFGVARFVADRVPVDAPLLIHDVGFLSTTLEHRLIDFVGLKSPHAAELHARLTWPTCGRDRVEVVQQLALESGARHLVVFDSWDRGFGITPGLARLGWALEPLRPVGVAYQVYWLTPPVFSPGLEAVAKEIP